MVRHRLDSVNEFARRGYNLRITCRVCRRQVEANSIEMMREIHRRGGSLAILHLEDRLKCSGCGWRGADIVPCDQKF